MGEASSHRRHLGRLRAEGVEGGRTHEAGGPLGEHRRHVDAGVDQPAADLDRLVGGDPGRDAEHHERALSPSVTGAPASRTSSTAPRPRACPSRYSVVSSEAGASSAASPSPSPSSRASAAASAAATSSGSGRV